MSGSVSTAVIQDVSYAVSELLWCGSGWALGVQRWL